MSDETLSATRTINASAEAVFAVLANPTTHQAIDGTGWVRESLDGKKAYELNARSDGELADDEEFPTW